MATPQDYEEFFQQYMTDLSCWAPDGITSIDLSFLHSIGLLKCRDTVSEITNSLTDYFHVVESGDRITLFNQRYVVWIVPRVVQGMPTTFTLITLLAPEIDPTLEVVFSTSGIYNAPRLILRVLEYYLNEIEENEAIISTYQEI